MGIEGDAPVPPRRQCGEEGGRLSYSGRLRVPQLLAQQRRELSEPALWDACPTALTQRGLPVCDDRIVAAPPAVARDRGSHDDFPLLWEPRAWL
ncbi:hypothetical protein AB0C27_22955 [Nonomuraea sp. NPDC048882]|uniref:hypothetical protein n=1 Tax=Nonomuraea sp. NPDC048882 TaxID=3154347 RepID=UPI0033C0EFC2